MIKDYRPGNFKGKLSPLFFFSGLILIFLFLTLFSQFFHNHSILEQEEFDCPLYLLSSQSLMSIVFVFSLFLILIALLREIFIKRSFVHLITVSLPDNKSPPC
ncbi:MAG: hypothetical protein ABFR36_08905 [Acidobacteriota bacterium]